MKILYKKAQVWFYKLTKRVDTRSMKIDVYRTFVPQDFCLQDFCSTPRILANKKSQKESRDITLSRKPKVDWKFKNRRKCLVMD